MKEAMKLMGMKTWIYWLSWYIKTMFLLLPGIFIMILCFKIKISNSNSNSNINKVAIMNETDTFMIFLILILYASSTITFTFLCTVFFNKANAAASGAGVIQFLTYLPFIYFSIRYDRISLLAKIASSFINNVCMGYGIQLIGMFEAKGTG